MKCLCKIFYLHGVFLRFLTLFLVFCCVLYLASSIVLADPANPTGGNGDPKGTIPRIVNNADANQTSFSRNSVLSQTIDFVIKSALVYGTAYIVERIITAKLFQSKGKQLRADSKRVEPCSAEAYPDNI